MIFSVDLVSITEVLEFAVVLGSGGGLAKREIAHRGWG
jgi:hypothetical protein